MSFTFLRGYSFTVDDSGAYNFLSDALTGVDTALPGGLVVSAVEGGTVSA